MSAVFEARSFLHHDAHYPSMTDADHDIKGEIADRFGETDVSELANYNPPALLSDDGEAMGHHHDADAGDRSIMPHDTVNDARLDLSPQSHLVIQTLPLHGAHDEQAAAHTHAHTHTHTAESTPTLAATALAATTTSARAMAAASTDHRMKSPSGGRVKLIPKPVRVVTKHPDGKYYCEWEGCTESHVGFKRRCEWNKHMDKHERPFRCLHQGCEKLAGFTYSGGQLRHEREVHGKHGGPKKRLNCPHESCKRHQGKGFSRQENLNEHLRRVHTEGASSPPPPPGATSASPPPALSAEDAHHHQQHHHQQLAAEGDNDDSDRGLKRRRVSVEAGGGGGEAGQELLEEVKRLRLENEQLRQMLQQQREMEITMVAQIAELQGVVRLNDANMSTPAP